MKVDGLGRYGEGQLERQDTEYRASCGATLLEENAGTQTMRR